MSQEEPTPAWALPAQQQAPRPAAAAAVTVQGPAQQVYPTTYYSQQPSQYSQTMQYTGQGYANQSQIYQPSVQPFQYNQQMSTYSGAPSYPTMTQPPVMVGPMQTMTYPTQPVQTIQLDPMIASSAYTANQYPPQTIQTTPPVAPAIPRAELMVDKPVLSRSLSTSAVPSSNDLSKRNLSALSIKSQDVEYEDGRVCNKEAMAKIRDAWIYTQLRMRASEFTQYKQVWKFQ